MTQCARINLASHVKAKHSCWQDELRKALEGPRCNSGRNFCQQPDIIIHQRLFESAVAKVQGNDFSLKAEEKRKVSFILINSNSDDEVEEEENGELAISFLDETQ